MSSNNVVTAGLGLLRRLTRRSQPTTTPRGYVPDSYPGDFTGRPTISYEPHEDEVPDPGEVVWTWIPFEEDHTQGKDRPTLIIGRDNNWLLGLQVTSQDHDLDAAQEAREDRYWADIGSGDWDRRRRPSEVRLNRIVRIDPNQVRRVGATLPKKTFDEVIEQMMEFY